MSGRARRLAPLTGLAGIGFIIAGLATDRAPTSSWGDARIEHWFAGHGTGGWLVSAYLMALGAPLLLVFTGVVGDRVGAAGPGIRSVLFGAGTALAVTVLVGAGLYAAVPAAITFADAPAPPAAIFRYLLGASYGVLVMFSAFASALLAFATSVAGLRTGALPRWLAIAGIPLSVLMLANAVLPMAAITAWFLVTSITLTVRRPIQPEPMRPLPAGKPPISVTAAP